MKLTHLFNNTCTQPNAYWPSCSQHPNTLSFRSIAPYNDHNESFKLLISSNNNINATYCNDSTTEQHKPLSPTALLLIHDEDLFDDEDQGGVERVIRGFKSDRLFFEPVETNSILSDQAAKKANGRRCSSGSDIIMEKKKTTTHVISLVSMESLDPYLDFKKSMQEMVEAQYHGVKQQDGWDWLQELLGCYLKVNGKSNHAYIIEAFVDLLAIEFGFWGS